MGAVIIIEAPLWRLRVSAEYAIGRMKKMLQSESEVPLDISPHNSSCTLRHCCGATCKVRHLTVNTWPTLGSARGLQRYPKPGHVHEVLACDRKAPFLHSESEGGQLEKTGAPLFTRFMNRPLVERGQIRYSV